MNVDERNKPIGFTGADGKRSNFTVVKKVAPFLAKMGLTYEEAAFGEQYGLSEKREP